MGQEFYLELLKISKMKYVLISLSCLTFVHLSAQELDSLKLDKTDTILEEMVITTQIEPQSLKKSIKNVAFSDEFANFALVMA